MKRKFFAFLLLLAIVLNTIITTDTSYASDENSIYTYVSDRISSYIYAGNFLDAKYLSDCFYVTDTNNSSPSHYAYFILSDEDILAMLYITEKDDSYTSSFISVSLDADIIGKRAALFQASDNIYIHCNDSDILLYGTSDYNVDISHLPLSYNVINTARELSLSPQSRSPIYYNLDVPFVGNGSDPNGKGLCWAAASASKINYTLGYSYTAMTVYNMCNSATNSGRPSGSPVGTISWIKFAFSIVKIPVTHVSSGLTFPVICATLKQQKPILCGFRGTAAHMVVLKGVYQDGGTTVYMFIDSNVCSSNGYYSVQVDDEALTKPSVFDYGHALYPLWADSIY